MNPYEHLSRTERLERIGTLLAKGVTLLLLHEEESKENQQSTSSVVVSTMASPPLIQQTAKNSPPTLPEEETSVAIVRYIQRVRSASPRDIQQALELPKTTAFRKLSELVSTGVLVRSGKTQAIRYRLMCSASSR